MQNDMMQETGSPMPAGSGKSSLPWVIGGIVVVAMIAALSFSTGSDEKEAKMETPKEDVAMVKEEDTVIEKKTNEAMVGKKVEMTLGAQNNSGQSGTATLAEIDGRTKVTVVIGSGAAGIAQPAHIHVGACPNPGAVRYPLTSVMDGKSETMLDVSLSTLSGELPLAINVHKSKDDAKTYVSCGDIVADAMVEKKTDGVMVKKAGTYETYEAGKLAMAKEGKVVLFFRASWCPTCRALDADIRKNLSAIPAGVTILDVDYDQYADLKKRYGITTQHTLVQVDAQGGELGKWVGSANLAELVGKVK